MPVYNYHKGFYTSFVLKRIDVDLQGVHFLEEMTPTASEIVRAYHKKLSSPLHIFQADGSAKRIVPNSSGVTEKCKIAARLLSEKIQPGSSLHDTARGFFAEYIGGVVLGDVANRSLLGKFCVVPAPPQCDAGSSTEKSADLLFAQVFCTAQGKEVLSPVVLFEIKSSQRNSKRHIGSNSALGIEVPVIKVSLGDLPFAEKADSVAESDYFIRHMEDVFSPMWFGSLSSGQQENLRLAVRYEVARGCDTFLENAQDVVPTRRNNCNRLHTIQEQVGLTKQVLGIDPIRYLQQRLGA